MKNENFDELICRVRDISMPECPDSLENNVLRRIRRMKDETIYSVADWLLELVPRPQFILTAVGLTLMVSLGSTFISNNLHAAIAQREARASEALGFDIFHGQDLLNLDKR